MADIRRWLTDILDLTLWLVAMLTLLQVLFGDGFVKFFGIDVVGNIGLLVQKFGNAGLVGIVAAALAAYLIVRNRGTSRAEAPASGQSGATPPAGGA